MSILSEYPFEINQVPMFEEIKTYYDDTQNLLEYNKIVEVWNYSNGTLIFFFTLLASADISKKGIEVVINAIYNNSIHCLYRFSIELLAQQIGLINERH